MYVESQERSIEDREKHRRETMRMSDSRARNNTYIRTRSIKRDVLLNHTYIRSSSSIVHNYCLCCTYQLFPLLAM